MYYQCYFAHFFSCSSIDFELPQGPQGTNGKSAYEIWKEEVETGHINWPSTQVDLADFQFILKEKRRQRKDGMSAYDQWKILITQGNVTNPHDPSLIWPSSKIQKPILGFSQRKRRRITSYWRNGNWYIGNKDTKSKLSAKMERMELMAKTDFPPMNYGNNLLLAAI